MNNLTILITPVANGFLVTLPFEVREFNPNHNKADFVDSLIEAAKIMSTDPMLRTEPERKGISKDENTFVFDSMEKVLAFLAERYL
jgi:hypothetical protein